MTYSGACYRFSQFYHIALSKPYIKDKVAWALYKTLEEAEKDQKDKNRKEGD